MTKSKATKIKTNPGKNKHLALEDRIIIGSSLYRHLNNANTSL